MPPSLSRKWRAFEKIQARLVRDKLLDVLKSFPSSTAFEFCETTLQGQDCNKILLGAREQADGAQANVWAYILPNNGDVVPPVLFRDEISLIGGGRREFPRPATSLLRKARDLYPPFCFLQFDPHENATGIRDMLCALVLYYALATDISHYALGWDNFESSLFKALKYITSRAEYCQRGRNELDNQGAALGVNNRQNAVKRRKQDETSVSRDIEKRVIGDREEIIHSSGSLVNVRAGTKLAQFKAMLGSKVRLLDQIPQCPVSISRHGLGAAYYPVRLRIGRVRLHDAAEFLLIDVHVYLTGRAQATPRILAHRPDGREMSWAFHDLQHVNLVEPFAQFGAATKVDSRTQGNKIQQLVCYYFMIAENEGFVHAPPIQIRRGLLSIFCAACETFSKQREDTATSSDTVASTSVESTGDTTMDTTPDSTELEEDARSESQARTSFTARLGQNSKNLEQIRDTFVSTQRSHAPDSEGEEDGLILDEIAPQQEASLHQNQPVSCAGEQMPLQQALEDARPTTTTPDAELTTRSATTLSPTGTQSDVQEMDLDRALGSCSMSISPVQRADVRVRSADKYDAVTTSNEASSDQPNMAGFGSRVGSPTNRSSQAPTHPTISGNVDEQRATSISGTISPKNDVLEETTMSRSAALSPRPQLVNRHRSVSIISISSSNNDLDRPQIIDLCSDGEDNGTVKGKSNLRKLLSPFRSVSNLDREEENKLQ